MLRLTLVAITVSACGTDPTPIPDRPDAAIGAEIPDPAPDAAKGACAEASQHSDFAWIQQHVFTPSCTSSACHDDEEPEVGLSLESGAAYANLVNKGASTVTGWTRVVPGSTTSSYLMVAFGRAPGPPPRDGFMPLLAEPLCAEKLEAVERWITQGALP